MSDNLNTKSASYLKHESQIKITQDIFNGSDTANNYLRKFPKEDSIPYKERQEDSALDNFVFSTVDTIKNIIFRKPIITTNVTNNGVKEWIKAINFQQNINEFAKKLLISRIRDGKTYILIDRMSFNANETLNGAQQTDNEKRPYFINIFRENLLDTEYDLFGNFSRVNIREFYTEKSGKFGVETKEQIRVWHQNGLVEIYRANELFSTIQTSLKEIPLVEIGSDDIPPLYDQAKLNIQHLNRNSECSNYVRVGASPFLAVYGNIETGNDQKTPPTLGINSGLKFTDKQSSGVEWVEMTGANFEIINSEITKIADMMIRKTVELVSSTNIKTATQIEKESTEGESKLNDYATELEAGINKALEFMQFFSEAALGENLITVNKDFNNSILSPEAANSYRMDYMQGIITIDQLWALYEAGEYLPLTDDKEKSTNKTLLKDSGIE